MASFIQAEKSMRVVPNRAAPRRFCRTAAAPIHLSPARKPGSDCALPSYDAVLQNRSAMERRTEGVAQWIDRSTGVLDGGAFRFLFLRRGKIPAYLGADVRALLPLHRLSAADGLGVRAQRADRSRPRGDSSGRRARLSSTNGLRAATCDPSLRRLRHRTVEQLRRARSGALRPRGYAGRAVAPPPRCAHLRALEAGLG
jgi:hypothetical protein